MEAHSNERREAKEGSEIEDKEGKGEREKGREVRRGERSRGDR